MAADIFTKYFVDPVKWQALCQMIYHVDPSTHWDHHVPKQGRGANHPLYSRKRKDAAMAAVPKQTILEASNGVPAEDDGKRNQSTVPAQQVLGTRVWYPII